MAVKRQRLHHRIAQQPQASADAYKGQPNPQPSAPSVSVGLPAPAQTAVAGVGGGHPAVAAPMVLPLAMVQTRQVDSNYVTLTAEDLAPITTADGAMIAATGPGKWDQLFMAGR